MIFRDVAIARWAPRLLNEKLSTGRSERRDAFVVKLPRRGKLPTIKSKTDVGFNPLFCSILSIDATSSIGWTWIPRWLSFSGEPEVWFRKADSGSAKFDELIRSSTKRNVPRIFIAGLRFLQGTS